MNDKESGIFRDAFYYLRDHDIPPAPGSAESEGWWRHAAEDMLRLTSVTWNNHPLAVQLGIAIYAYLECKGCERGHSG